jgi:hypothetical protein
VFTYSENNRLLSYPLDPGAQNLKPEHQRFAAARSMRDVEPNVQLKLRDPYGQPLSEQGEALQWPTSFV